MSPNKTIRIGSRGSDLAIRQARWVEEELRKRWPDCTLVLEVIRTKGDRILDSPLTTIGDRGLFTREIEEALLSGAIDCAVHSLKDLPTELPPGLIIGAVSRREDVRDVFIPHPRSPVRTLSGQLPGATVATGSLRRRCQVLAFRSDLVIADIRGNLTTRMRKLEDSTWGGMVLARAGVVRLGWEEVIGETLDAVKFLPAVGQGALGVEIRSDDDRVRSCVAVIADQVATQATGAERALLHRLGGGCQVPIGAYGRIESGVLKLDAMVGSPDGGAIVRGSVAGDPRQADSLGVSLAEELLSRGADRILESIHPPAV